MSFYQAIAHYYDQIFPVKEEQYSFIRGGKKKLKVLDVACGNGGYLNKLSEFGFYGFGVDLDHEMIQIANTEKTSEKIDFYEMDMLEIDTFKARSFDMIYSIGNSIVHLSSVDQVKELLMKAYQLLKPKGEIILQIINYDRILDQNVTQLPTISNDGLSMERKYQIENNRVLFRTVLHIAHHTFENEVTLLPMRSDMLLKTLTDIGFRKCEMYGDFKKTPFLKQESMHFIVKACR
jgi:glycine/sarcosine N-methyltransferase